MPPETVAARQSRRGAPTGSKCADRTGRGAPRICPETIHLALLRLVKRLCCNPLMNVVFVEPHAYARMRHPDYDVLRGMLDASGRTLHVDAT